MYRGTGRHAFQVLAVLSLLLSGCAEKKPTAGDLYQHLKQKDCKRVPIEVFLQASPYLNQNEKGQSMPVEVRVYLLRSRQTFDGLDFETLWQRGDEALSREMIRNTSLTVFPGKLKIYSMESDGTAAFVALVAIFRKPEGGTWSQVLDIREKNKRCATKDALHNVVHALLKDNTITKSETSESDA